MPNLTDIKFLANENVPVSSVTYLKSIGDDIKAIGLDKASISDKQVMKIAMDEHRTIITYDSDYGDLIFKHGYRPNAGVIFIRYQPSEPFETAKILLRITEKSNLTFSRALTVIDSTSIRQKKY